MEVTKEDIQEQLVERLQEEKRQEALRRKERNEAHLFMSINAYTEDSIMTYKGADLVSIERTPCFNFKVSKSGTYREALATIAEQMKYPVEAIRLWPFLQRNNHSYRPTRVSNESEVCANFLDAVNCAVFVETAPAKVPIPPLPVSEKDGELEEVFSFCLLIFIFTSQVHVLIFFKYYDIKNVFLTYCGCGHFERRAKVSDLYPIMCEKAGLPPGTPLRVFEEEYQSCIHPMTNAGEMPLEEAVNELMDGDIIAFERADVVGPAGGGPASLTEYFADMLHRVEVLFCDKNNPSDPGFLLELSLKMTYNQIAGAVAMRLGTDPSLLQFFKNQSSYREGPGGPLRCNFEGTLKDILLYFKPRQPKKIYFQHVSVL